MKPHLPFDRQAPYYRRDEALAPLVETLLSDERPVRLVSFDFFDTLVHRWAPEPVDAFTEMGRRLAAAGLFVRPLEPEAYRQVRQAAEQKARRKSHNSGRTVEVNLAQIHDELRNVVRDTAASARIELEVEREYCFPNLATTTFAAELRARGYEVAIVSDIYLSADALRSILAQNGVDPEFFTTIITSSDEQAWKGNGSLFRVLHERLGIAPHEMMHVGDSPAADVQGASAAGVRGHLYYRKSPHTEEVLKRERHVLAARTAPSAGFDYLRIFAQRTLPSEDDDALAGYERDGAFLLGPALARFADWCVAEFVAAGVRTVLAPMREGELLGEMLRRAAAAKGVPLVVHEPFLSRQATALPSVGAATKDSLQPLVISPLRYTVREFFARIGLHEGELPVEGEFLDREVDSDAVLDTLLRFATQGWIKQRVEALSKEKRDTLWAYLSPMLGDDLKIGVIDLGWAGTIQSNLARIAELVGRPVEFVGRYLLTNARACARLLEGADVRSMLGNMGAVNGLAKAIWVSPQPLEETINACCGSTAGYRRTETGAEPVLDPVRVSDEEKEKRERVQAGIRHFQRVWLDVSAQKRAASGTDGWSPAMWADLDHATFASIHRLINFPVRAEAERFGGLHREENFFSDHFVPIASEPARDALWQGGVAGLLESRESCWPQAVVALDDACLGRALALGWEEPHSLGRAGQRPSHDGAVRSMTAEESAVVEDLVAEETPDHIVVVGLDAPGDAGWLADLAAAARPEAPARVTHVPALEAQEVVRLARRTLRPTQRNLLVVDRRTPAHETRALLARLTPFLGGETTIAVGHGGREPFAMPTEAGTFRAMRAWLHESGLRQGFDLHRRSKRAPEVMSVVTRRAAAMASNEASEQRRSAQG